MSPLALTIAFKIFVTVVWIALCWLPSTRLTSLGVPPVEPILFLRLLGMAYLALLVGYIIGLFQALAGQTPTAVVTVGVVSNGRALLFLLWFGWKGAWQAWKPPARTGMWLFIPILTLITSGLVVFGAIRL